MEELETVKPEVAAGLEDDPELVRLWRKMGGPRHRHHKLHEDDRKVITLTHISCVSHVCLEAVFMLQSSRV